MLLLGGGRGGGVGRLAARVGTQDEECRDGYNDDANDDVDHKRTGEAGSLARRSGRRFHGWLDARSWSSVFWRRAVRLRSPPALFTKRDEGSLSFAGASDVPLGERGVPEESVRCRAISK
jgi:hypothetical protein